MKSNDLKWTKRGSPVRSILPSAILIMGLVGSVGAHSDEHSRLPENFSGLLNDYTPPAPAVSGGPYEMHGRWSLHLRDRFPAVFVAEMSMETADFANLDPNHDPTKLGPHTHHISVTDGVIHDDPADPINWKANCPAFKPPVSDGFVVTGTAYITGNGGNPPFGNPSQVTICILGGMQNAAITGPQAFVEFSNFTLSFADNSLASTHFGTQAINGVVTKCERPWAHQSGDCKVSVVD
jgi:hypothetical protein